MTELEFVCKKCQKRFVCDVGHIFFPPNQDRPTFEADIVCSTCGVLTMDDVELTEYGQTQISSVFLSSIEK